MFVNDSQLQLQVQAHFSSKLRQQLQLQARKRPTQRSSRSNFEWHQPTQRKTQWQQFQATSKSKNNLSLAPGSSVTHSKLRLTPAPNAGSNCNSKHKQQLRSRIEQNDPKTFLLYFTGLHFALLQTTRRAHQKHA